MATKTKTATRPSLSDYADWVAAEYRLRELQAQLRHAEHLVDEEEDRLRRLKSSTSREGLSAAATKAIAGESWREPDDERPGLQTLRHDVAVLERAIELQREEVERQRVAAARDIGAKTADEHRAVGHRIAAALDQLEAALRDEADLRHWALVEDVVRDPGGLPPHWQPLAFPAVGTSQDVPQFQRIAAWRDGVREYLIG